MSRRLFEQLREFVAAGGWPAAARSQVPVGDLPGLVSAIEQADLRFVLAPEVSAAAWQVATRRPETLVKAWDFLRVPAATVWLEWPDRLRRENFSEAFGSVPALKPTQFHPEKSGVLIIAEPGGRRGTMRWVWGAGRDAQFPNSGHTSILVAEFDFDDPGLGPRASMSGLRTYCEPGGWFQLYDARTPQTRIIRDHFRFRVSADWFTDVPELRSPALRDRMHEALQQSGSNDLAGEIEHVVACLLLLVARQGVKTRDVSDEDLAKLNKTRGRKGKPALLRHREVSMKLTQVRDRRASAQAAASGASKALHLVMGHFKTRKTGVYWWNAHWRGDAAKGKIAGGRTVTVTP